MTAISVKILEQWIRDAEARVTAEADSTLPNRASKQERIAKKSILAELAWAIQSCALSPPPVAQGEGLVEALEGMLAAFEGRFSFNDQAAFEQVACNNARTALKKWNTRPTLAREWVPVSDGVKKYQTYIVKVRTKEGNLFVSTGICTGEEWERETPASEHQNIETCNFSDLGMQVIEYMPLPELAPQPPQQQQENGGCECRRCLSERDERTESGWPVLASRMILCSICGNKRCPHATDHRNECTNSNEPGQPGSSYGPINQDNPHELSAVQIAISDEQKHILLHSLGLTRGGPAYRNHFVTGPGSTDYDDCCALVEAGFMTKRTSSLLPAGDLCFNVTESGKALALSMMEKKDE
jgi:hypothetical protein